MPISSPEVLAENLFDRLQTPAQGTPEALQDLLRTIQNNDQKPDILARVREKLKALSPEQQEQFDTNLKALEARVTGFAEGVALLQEVSKLRAELQELKESLPPATTATEWLQREWTDISTDFMEGSAWKKAGYLTGAYLGYRVVTGLWNKIRSVFTSSEKKGFFGKLLSLGATAVGTVAGALGVSQLLKAFGQSEGTNPSAFTAVKGPDGRPILSGFFDRRTNNPIIPDVVEDVVDPVAEGTYRGLDDMKTFFGPAFDALYEHENIRKVMESRDDYESSFEYVQAIVTAALADGVHFAFDGATGFLSVGGKLISLTGEFGTILFGGLVDGELDTGDLLSVYVEGTVLYATSLVALKAITLNRYGRNANILWEAGAWPVYTVKRTYDAAKRTLSFTHELASSSSATRLGFERKLGALNLKRLRLGRFMGISEEGLALQHMLTVDQVRLLEKARASSSVDPETLRLFETQEAKAVKQFREYLLKFVKKNGGRLPDWFVRAQDASSAKGIAPDLLTAAHLRDIVTRVDRTVTPEVSPEIPNPRSSVRPEEPELHSRTQTPEDVSSSGTQQATDDAIHAAEEAAPSSVPHGTNPENAPHSPLPQDPVPQTSAPHTPPRRTAVGDGVVPEAAPSLMPERATPSWSPRVVRPDGTVFDPATNQVIENIGETAEQGSSVTEDVVRAAEDASDTLPPPQQTDDVLREAELITEEWRAGVRTLQQDMLGANATQEVYQAFDAAVEQCKVLRLSLADTRVLLQDAASLAVLSGRVPGVSSEILASSLRVASAGGTEGIKRVSRYIVSLGSHTAETLLDPAIIRTIAEMTDFHPQAVSRFFGKLASKNLLAGVTSEQLVETIRGLNRWQKAGNLARGLHVGFAVLDSAFLAMDVVSLAEMRRRHAETIRTMESSLQRAGFIQQGNRWVHKGTGASVELRQLQDSVLSLSNPQTARVAADVAGLPLLLPCISFGPAGLAIGVTLIVVHAGITTWEQSENRAFLENTPTAVLAALTTEGTVGQSASDIVADMSTWMISDVLHPFSNFNEEQKRVIRTKMMAIMLAHELSDLEQTHPGITSLVTGGKDITSFLDERSELLSQDFDTVLKPYIAARLFQRSNDGTVKWNNFRDLKVDDGIFDFENVDASDMRLILRQAVFLYTKHVIQREYQRQSASLQERRAARQISGNNPLEYAYQIEQNVEIGDEDQSEEDRLDTLGRETIFGTAISELPQGETMVLQMMRTLTQKFDAVDQRAVTAYNHNYYEGDSDLSIEHATRDQMMLQDKNLFSIDLPEELLTAFPQANVGLSRLPSDILSSSGENIEESLAVVLPAAERTYNEVKNVALAGLGAWQAGESHYKTLADYAALLASHTNLDPTGLRAKIISLGERFNWSGAYPGSEFMGKRNDAFRGVVKEFVLHLSYLQSRLPRQAENPSETSAYYEREVSLVSVRNAPSITVTPDGFGLGEERTLNAVPGKTMTFDAPPFGQVKCVSTVSTEGKSFYEWSFTPKNDSVIGSAFVVSATVNSQVHAQHERAIKELQLQRTVSSTGEVTYTREGYTGQYILQSDGTVFYSGGIKTSSGKTFDGVTYVMPSQAVRQDYFERSQEVPRGKWLPIHEPIEPVTLVKERIEIKRMQDLALSFRARKEGMKIYFPASGWMDVKLTLLDGTVIEGRYARDFAAQLKPYFTVTRARVRNFRGYDFDGQAWHAQENPSEEPVSCMILSTTAEGALNLASIELSDYNTTSRGYKHVYRFPEPQSQSETPPALTSN